MEFLKKKRSKAKYSKLDSFKPFIHKLLSKNVWNAIVIFREIQEKCYNGGITILRDYIQPKHVLRVSRATVRFETELDLDRKCKVIGGVLKQQ